MEHGTSDHHSISSIKNQFMIDELWFSILAYEKEGPWQQAKETALASSRGQFLFSFRSYTPSVSRGAQTHAEKISIKWEFFLDKRSSPWYSTILPCRILSLSLEGRRDQGQGEQLNNVIRQACKDLSKNTPVRAWKGLPMYCSSETVTYQYGPREAIYSRWIRIDM